MVSIGTFSERKIGSISSDVERYTENNVPIVMTLPAYRLDAAAENPHCGRIPRIPPHKVSEIPCLADPLLHFSSGMMFQFFHQEISQKQERNQFDAVMQCIQ